MKFAHLGDCHLGSWRQPELKELNFKSFQLAIEKSIKEKVDFMLVAGDLFDTAYPPIETLKETFNEFRKVKDNKIPVFLIAGSHDYSVSGKTFLDVLEKAGFCTNVAIFEEKNDKIMLLPTTYKNVAIYGYPGKKSGLEVDDVSRITIQDSPGMFKILMLHTTIKDAIGNLPIKSVDEKKLPKVDYLALAHLHINYQKENRVYCGPIFPNNLAELEDLKQGSFFIFDNGKIRKQEIKLAEVEAFNIETNNSLEATDKILSEIQKKDLRGKIVLTRVSGVLEKGKISDIDFLRIESFAKAAGAKVYLKSTSKLHVSESESKISLLDTDDIELKLLELFEEKNPGPLNYLIPSLMKSLQIEKLEDETQSTFEDRILSESRKVLEHEIQKN